MAAPRRLFRFPFDRVSRVRSIGDRRRLRTGREVWLAFPTPSARRLSGSTPRHRVTLLKAERSPFLREGFRLRTEIREAQRAACSALKPRTDGGDFGVCIGCRIVGLGPPIPHCSTRRGSQAETRRQVNRSNGPTHPAGGFSDHRPPGATETRTLSIPSGSRSTRCASRCSHRYTTACSLWYTSRCSRPCRPRCSPACIARYTSSKPISEPDN